MDRKLRRIKFILIVLYQFTCMVRSTLPEELLFLLPQNVTPVRYEVTIEHDIDNPTPTYSGDVRIKVYCTAETKTISFNQAGSVEVHDVEVNLLSTSENSHFAIIGSDFVAGNQSKLTLNMPLEIGKNYEIKIYFSNTFVSTGSGYIFKKYEQDGVTNAKSMTFTILNEFDARRVIPCLDQINLKAQFKMWLIHPKRLKGFSNAILVSSDDIDGRPGWVKDEFRETENMATFSLAVALLEFESTGFHSALKVNVQTWADRDVVHRMSYINELASKSFDFFSKLFDNAHPLGKLDILILPEADFQVKESFGVIFMSQNYVLDILEKSSKSTTYAMVSKICHAVSYQWIGCSVTMSRWRDDWFHQGLNYFLQEECAKKIFPEYSSGVSDLNTIESFIAFMRSEEIAVYNEPIAMLKSYPTLYFMEFVSLEKVYHLIRMIHFITGPNLFEESLESYTNDFVGLNLGLDEAMDVFTKKANSVSPPKLPYFRFKIQTIVQSWLRQPGVPLIFVERNDVSAKITLTPKIFNSLELDKDPNDSSRQPSWMIPLSCTTEKESQIDVITPRVWLEDSVVHWKPPVAFERDDWILCNLDFNVPGRVLYDDKTWLNIQKFFADPNYKFRQINVLTRARLVSDMFRLAEAGELYYQMLFSIIKYLQHEEDLAPWMIALKEFDLIRSRLLGSDLALLERYQKFVRSLLEPVFQERIVKNFFTDSIEDTLESDYQISFMEISCKFDLEGCLEKSSEFKKIWDRTSKQGKELEIRRRLYRVVLCEQIKHGNSDTWTKFWKSYHEEDEQSSKEDFLQAFACSQKTKDLQRLLEESISDRRISRKDSIFIFQSLSGHKHGYKLMKDFFLKSYKKINSFHSEDEQWQLSYLRILFNATNRRRDLNKIVQFAISKHVDMTDKHMPDKLTNKCIDNARRNITWAQENKKEVKEALSDFSLKKLYDKFKNKLKFK